MGETDIGAALDADEAAGTGLADAFGALEAGEQAGDARTRAAIAGAMDRAMERWKEANFTGAAYQAVRNPTRGARA